MTSVDEYMEAQEKMEDRWVPAAGGREEPFTKNGFRLLYCYNHAQDRHAYIDLGRDVELTDDEAREIMS